MFRFSFFSISILLGAVMGHAYLYRRLVRDTRRGRAFRVATLALFGLMALLLVFRWEIKNQLPVELGETVARVTYAWMGVALFLVMALLVLDLGRGLLALGHGLSPPGEVPSSAWSGSTRRGSTGMGTRTSS